MSGIGNRIEFTSFERQVAMPTTDQTLQQVSQTAKTADKSDYTLSNGKSMVDNIAREQQEIEKMDILKEVEKLNEQMKANNKTLRFKYSEDAGKYFVQIINPATQEVLDNLPPEYLIDLSAKMKALIGLFIDKKL